MRMAINNSSTDDSGEGAADGHHVTGLIKFIGS
jgi:hypothetical protein